MQRIKEFTDIGVDVCFEFVGNINVVTQCVNSVRPGGIAVIVGADPRPSMISTPRLFREEVVITGSYGAPKSLWREIINLISGGKIDLQKYVSYTINMWDIDKVNDLFRNLDEIYRENFRVVLING